MVTWSASEVESMLISSLSAVSLHICSHLSFRSRSRRRRITPGKACTRICKHAHRHTHTQTDTHTRRQRYGSLRNREISILLPGKGDKFPSWSSESQSCIFWDKAGDFKLADSLALGGVNMFKSSWKHKLFSEAHVLFTARLPPPPPPPAPATNRQIQKQNLLSSFRLTNLVSPSCLE